MSHVDPKRFAEVFEKGDPEKGIQKGSLRLAMMEAGYSENTANLGKSKLSAECWAELADRKIKLGKLFNPELRAAYVRGGLLENTIQGKDTAVKSYELLGKDKEVQMFTADSQVGVIILTAPTEYKVSEVVEPPQVGAPVDLVEG